MLATRDIELTQATVRELYAQGQAERARAIEAVLSQALAGREPAGSPRSEYLTTGQAARALGVSLQTIKNWVAAGHLRAVRLGGRLLVPRGAIQANLDKLREAQQQTRAPTAAEAAAAQRQHESVVASLRPTGSPAWRHCSRSYKTVGASAKPSVRNWPPSSGISRPLPAGPLRT